MKETTMEITIDDTDRQECEVWTRVMGYHRPVASFNAGKKSEHRQRLFFRDTGVPGQLC